MATNVQYHLKRFYMSNITKRDNSKKNRDINDLPPWAFLRVPEICACTGWARSTLYQKINDGKIPALIKIGERASGQTVEKTRQVCEELVT